MNTSRTSLSPHSAVVNGKIYVIGGFDGTAGLSSVEEYDPITDTWTFKAPMNDALSQHEIAVVDTKIYVIGGTINFPNPVSATLEYNPQTNTWQTKADMPTARRNLTAAVINNKIYVIGGLNAANQEIPTVEMFDPRTNTWAPKANMNIAKTNATASVVHDKIYILGGFKQNGPLSNIEEYDPSSDIWNLLPYTIVARNLHTTAVVNEKIYIIGGGAIPNVGISDTVEVFDPNFGTIEALESMQYARAALTSAVVNGKIYAIGGRLNNNSVTNIVEEYTPNASSLIGEWTLVKAVSNGNSIEDITGGFHFKNDSIFSADVKKGSSTGESTSWYEIVGNMLNPAINENIIWFGRSFGFSQPGRDWETIISCTESEFENFVGYSIGWSPSNENILISLSNDTLTISIEGKATFFKYVPSPPTHVTTNEDKTGPPTSTNLSHNYPNPFNSVTTIAYSLSSPQHITIKIFDMLGHEIGKLVDEQRHAGYHEIQFDAAQYPSGVYLYRLEAGNYTQTRKLILLK
jgi:N-acetylneuraminic acid mutarotase